MGVEHLDAPRRVRGTLSRRNGPGRNTSKLYKWNLHNLTLACTLVFEINNLT
jgi:hypothetical protein